MTPERLLVMAVKSGIDLGLIASKEPPPRKARPRIDPVIAERQRKMLGCLPTSQLPRGVEPETFLTAHGKPGQPSWMPEWTPQDFAHACKGMRDLPWSTLCYTVYPAGDEDRVKLKAALMLQAADLAIEQSWPKKMRRADCLDCGRTSRDSYLEDLCTLALIEWREPEKLRSQEALARWFGITQAYWSSTVVKRYHPIRVQLEFWYGEALGTLFRALREPVITDQKVAMA